MQPVGLRIQRTVGSDEFRIQRIPVPMEADSGLIFRKPVFAEQEEWTGLNAVRPAADRKSGDIQPSRSRCRGGHREQQESGGNN